MVEITHYRQDGEHVATIDETLYLWLAPALDLPFMLRKSGKKRATQIYFTKQQALQLVAGLGELLAELDKIENEALVGGAK